MKTFKRFAAVTTLAAAVLASLGPVAPVHAGRVGGSGFTNDRVEAYGRQSYTVTFRGGESAMVYVSGDGDSDLDLYIYDENGNLIASDQDGTDQCLATWTPKWTGRFTIEVRNRGGIYNRFALRTN